MFKSISNAIISIFSTIEKTANVAERSIDLVDNEVGLLEQRQNIRMKAIRQELEEL